MQGQRLYQPTSTLITMERLVPSDHFLRQVDLRLKLDFVRQMTSLIIV